MTLIAIWIWKHRAAPGFDHQLWGAGKHAMSARTTSEVVRHATNSAKKVRNASTASLSTRKRKTTKPEHGRQIFVFTHLQNSMVVYSLTRTLKNNASLAQLPFNGKKTVPAALRKDLWHPLAQISFPPGHGTIGLSAFQKLREYRRRHELEWDMEIMKDKGGEPLKKKYWKWKICDQKANSVADIAAVLARLELQEGEEEVKKGGIGLKGEGTGQKVEVLWTDLNDAEFAETWSENVEHGLLRHRPKDVVWDLERTNLEAEAEKARLSESEQAGPPPHSSGGGEREKVVL